MQPNRLRPYAGRTPAVWTVVVAVAAVAALVGCEGPQGGAARASARPVPVDGGTLRLAMEAPLTLDPSLSGSVYESLPVNQIFDGLVEIDASLGIRPALAQTWEISDDGRVYTFHLRPDARFHDGQPVGAEDVRFTLERLLCPVRGQPSMAAPYLRIIEGAEAYVASEAKRLSGVRVLDPRTVEIRLERPYPTFLEVLSVDGLNIVPRHVVEAIGNEEFARHPVGSGPFRLERWDADRLVLARNPEYFLGFPHLDSVEIQFLRDGELDAGAGRFHAGDIDVLEPSNDELDRLTASGTAVLHRYQELSLSFLGFGTTMAPVDRVEVRQAIAHAIDRTRLVAQSPGSRREATGIIPPGMLAYSPDPKALAHDPDRARLLLKRAGYSEDRPVPPLVLYTSSSSPTAQTLLASVGEDLAEVGIPLEVRPVSWPVLTDLIERRAAPAFLLAWIADMNDPDSFVRGLLDMDSAGNYFGFEDPDASAMLEAGLLESNPAERTRIYRQLESRVLSQAPLVPLYHSRGLVATRRGVHGVEPGPMGIANVEFERVWIAHAGEGASEGGAR